MISERTARATLCSWSGSRTKAVSSTFFTTDFERRDGKTIVTIGNKPNIVASVKSGDRIEIPKTDITDWFYMRDGKYVGMRTIKPRFKHMSAEQVEGFKQVLIEP